VLQVGSTQGKGRMRGSGGGGERRAGGWRGHGDRRGGTISSQALLSLRSQARSRDILAPPPAGP